MRRPSARRLFEAFEAHVPARLRAEVKRRYRREKRTRPLHSGDATRDEPRRRLPRFAAIGDVGPLPIRLHPITAGMRRRGSRPDLCLAAPGPLDGILDGLLAAEEEAVPLVCIARTEADLDSEVAGCATAIAVASDGLVARAEQVVPREFVVVSPTVIATRDLPVAGLRDAPASEVLFLDRDGGPSWNPDEVRAVDLDPATSPQGLAAAARTAVAVAAPRAEAPPEAVAAAATLATCGVPLVGPTDARHPLDGLATAIAAHDLLPRDPEAAVASLASDVRTARIAAVRARRYALTTLSAGAFVRGMLEVARLPTTPTSVSAIVRVADVAHLPDLRASLARQQVPPTEVVLVVPPELAAAVRMARPALPWPGRVVLDGRLWLSRAVGATTGRYVALLDSDSVYGPDHLGDLLTTLESTGAAMVGRNAHFQHDPSSGGCLAVPGTEEGDASWLVPGTTLVARSRAASVTRGGQVRSERDLQRRIGQRGGRLYALHPYGFLHGGVASSGAALPDATLPWEDAFPEGAGGVPFIPASTAPARTDRA